jgi:hypothetical protein
MTDSIEKHNENGSEGKRKRKWGDLEVIFISNSNLVILNLEMPHIQEPRHGPASASRPIPNQDAVSAAESDTLSKNYTFLR